MSKSIVSTTPTSNFHIMILERAGLILMKEF